MPEVYLWMIRLASYDGDGYDAEWLSADPGEAALYEHEEGHEVTIVSTEVVDDA